MHHKWAIIKGPYGTVTVTIMDPLIAPNVLQNPVLKSTARTRGYIYSTHLHWRWVQSLHPTGGDTPKGTSLCTPLFHAGNIPNYLWATVRGNTPLPIMYYPSPRCSEMEVWGVCRVGADPRGGHLYTIYIPSRARGRV